MTAAELLTALQETGCEPTVDGEELVLSADPPDTLAVKVQLLHTGVRAILTGKRWYGCDTATGRTVALDPAAPIPHNVGLLIVEGAAEQWDRIHPLAHLDSPESFAPHPTRTRVKLQPL